MRLYKIIYINILCLIGKNMLSESKRNTVNDGEPNEKINRNILRSVYN